MGWRNFSTIMVCLNKWLRYVGNLYSEVIAGVDIALSGHEHIYERYWPIYDFQVYMRMVIIIIVLLYKLLAKHTTSY